MNSRVFIHSYFYCCLVFALIPAEGLAQREKSDVFLRLIHDVVESTPEAHSGGYVVPTDADLAGWARIANHFRERSLDSCRTFLARFNYELTQVHDGVTGGSFDVIRERLPVTRGWGTFIYNRNFKKQLYIHVNHPLDDGNATVIGAELFRRLSAEWLLVAGTDKDAGADRAASDIAKAKRSVFQLLHEQLTDPSHVTLSVHGYHSPSFQAPIRTSDVILSNGRTSDDQWGISQLSLSFRDSVSGAGFRCALAMYDSGLARLAGGGNAQGLYSNDIAGFGHWINMELSERVRYAPSQYLKIVAATDRALGVIGKQSAQHASRAFGLVSPRVVRVDSLRRMLFPPTRPEGYRIISFNAASKETDSAQVLFGGWLNFGDGRPTTRVVVDTGSGDFARQLRAARRKTGSQVSRVIPADRLTSAVFADSNAADDAPTREPLQVHRIPLQAVLVSTMTNATYVPASTSYKWEGPVSARFIPGIQSFQMKADQSSELRGIPSFLIPLITSSYDTDAKRFVGVQMTSILVNEIARLVNEHNVTADDVALYAEEAENGDYFLRIFPSAGAGEAIVQNTP